MAYQSVYMWENSNALDHFNKYLLQTQCTIMERYAPIPFEVSFITIGVEAYLRNRLQFVEISGARTSLLSVPLGMPQGSVLGPLLFLIYVNDIAPVVPPFVDVSL